MRECCHPFVAGPNHRRGIADTLRSFAAVSALVLVQPGVGQAQTQVRDLDNPARQPFQAELRQVPIPAFGESESFRIADVPAGKRLVIEHVSFRVANFRASIPGEPVRQFGTFASLITKANGVGASHELITQRIDLTGGQSFSVASQPIRAYADPGTPVSIVIGSITDDHTASLRAGHLTISGYLVDLQ
jgi:hypothetical protein